jgi:ABC-2 type transport system permease protein
MLLKMLSFEWRYYTKQPSFIVTCLVFFLLPFLLITIEEVTIGSGGNTNINSPYAIANILLLFGVFNMFVVVNFIASTATRNDSSAMAEIICTKPIPPTSYQLGRFLGAFLVCLTVYAMVPLALVIGSFMPWLDQERLGSFHLSHYLAPFLVFSVSTIFVLSTLFYAVALRFKSNMAVYLTALALFIIYLIAPAVFDEPNQQQIIALIDPFGLRTFTELSAYWSPFERNSLTVSLTQEVLLNRAIWIGLGLSCLLLFGRLFTPLSLFIASTPSKSIFKSKSLFGSKTVPSEALSTAENADTSEVVSGELRLSRGKYQQGAGFKQFSTRIGFEIRQIVFSPAFSILMLFCVFNLVAQFFDPQGLYGAANYPLTQTMVQLIESAFFLVNIVVITYYSAEVIWRERNVGIGDITDSMPVANVTYWLSKFLAVCLVIFCILAIGMLSTILNQLSAGYTYLEIGQYIFRLFYFVGFSMILLVVLSFLIQTMSPNKYVGMLIFVGYFLVASVFSSIGLEHNMYQYSSAPILQYSDMNGYGWFVSTQNWYSLYWGALAVIFSIVSYGLWHRGPHSGLKARFRLLSYQIGRGGATAIGLSALAFVFAGSVIHYNTKVLNEFTTADESQSLSELYEKEFSEYEDDPVPVIVSVDADIAIFPQARRVETVTKVILENRSDTIIERFLVNHPRFTDQSELEIEGGELGARDPKLNSAWFTFDEPLLPGEKRDGTIRLVREHMGFKDRGEDTSLVENGTFINNMSLYPSFGVNQSYYLNDKHERRKRDLPPPRRAYKLEDKSRYYESFFGPSVALIDFKARVSTSIDQTAIVPGYLKAEWEQDGRRYFEYEMDSPMLNFFSITSARLLVKKETYKGVEIVVYYHKDHYWNVDRMIESTKDSLDYFTQAFGPYQHRQLRIIEFPGYQAFAQSFANTVPYSEKIGFITDLRDPAELDPVYYVTAHEVAHQWFGHQLNAANVQGSAVLSESLAQYAALLVMEKKYGEDKIRKFLTFELDSYLRGRANEQLEELPMLRAENQAYIHYRKGSVVMMALRDRIGEEALNKALADLIKQYKFSDDVQPTTLDLLAAMKHNTTENNHAFIDAQFTQISLYDIKVESAELAATDASANSSDKKTAHSFQLTLNVFAKQLMASGNGEETEQDFDDLVDIVVFSQDPNDFDGSNHILYQAKHRLVSGGNTLEIDLDLNSIHTNGGAASDADLTPRYVGVDPFVRFIDRDSRDNILRL